jgi:hypothetical protein
MINASSPRTPHQLASPVYRCRTNKGLRPTGWKTVVMIPICLQAVILLLGDPLARRPISSASALDKFRVVSSTRIFEPNFQVDGLIVQSTSKYREPPYEFCSDLF